MNRLELSLPNPKLFRSAAQLSSHGRKKSGWGLRKKLALEMYVIFWEIRCQGRCITSISSTVEIDCSAQLPPPPHKSSGFIPPAPDFIVIKWQIHSGSKVLQGIFFGIEDSFFAPWQELSWLHFHTVSTHPGGWTLFCLYFFPHELHCCFLIALRTKSYCLCGTSHHSTAYNFKDG